VSRIAAGLFAWNTRRLITEQIHHHGEREVRDQRHLRRRGLLGLGRTVENRALRPGANLPRDTRRQGQAIAGNVGSLAPGVMATSAGRDRLSALDDRTTPIIARVVHVTNWTTASGFDRRDLETETSFRHCRQGSAMVVIVVIVLGLGGGILCAAGAAPYHAMTGTTQRHQWRAISAGGSVGRTAIELDRWRKI